MNISIVIPVLNEAARIGQLVTYLREQGGTSVLEVLVVDGGSDDTTAEEARAAGAIFLPGAIGCRAVQMNAGAEAAKGDVLYFIHADTCPPKSFVMDIQASLKAGYAMGCYRYRFDSPRILLKVNAYFNRFSWLWCQGGDKTFFIRKSVFEGLGGYDEYYTVMEEYDFLRRAMPLYRLHVLPKYAIVSARKYEKNSWLRVQLANTVVFNLFRLGVSPARLKRLYKTFLH